MSAMEERSEAEGLWARALEPPQGLIDYRFVMEGRQLANENQRQLASVFQTAPAQFRKEWREEEKAYRDSLAKMVAAKGQAKAKEEAGGPPVPPDEVDEGSKRVEELLERLLKEAQP